jgi:hypothetical protein
MNEALPEPSPPGKGQFLVYAAEDGRIKIDVRLANETVWLPQQLIAELFQTTVLNISITSEACMKKVNSTPMQLFRNS